MRSDVFLRPLGMRLDGFNEAWLRAVQPRGTFKETLPTEVWKF